MNFSSESYIKLDLPSPGTIAYTHIQYLSETIGTRLAGSANEQAAHDYIFQQFEKLGYQVASQSFKVNKESEVLSANVVASIQGKSEYQFIVGGHYDSVAKGHGAADNASSIGVMLEVASLLTDPTVMDSVSLPFSVKFIAFGSEEMGLVGSKAYAAQMHSTEIAQTLAMINLDAVIGGDYLYVHGGSNKAGWVRTQILAAGGIQGYRLRTNPGHNTDYPAGTAGAWSDHAPFEDRGIPYGYFESTNWDIGDLDGFVQTETAGAIWHTEKDTLNFLESTFPGRVQKQLHMMVEILTHILINLNPPDTGLSRSQDRPEQMWMPVLFNRIQRDFHKRHPW